MEWTTIVLGIIVLLLIYTLYIFFVRKSSVISKSASLKEGNNEPVTKINSVPEAERPKWWGGPVPGYKPKPTDKKAQ